MQWSIWILVLALTSLTAAAMGINARRLGGTTLAARASVAVMGGLALWAATYAMQWASATLPAQLFWEKSIYFGVVLVPAGFFVLALALTRHEGWLTRRRLALLAVEPVLCLVAVWTNPGGLFIARPSLSEQSPFALRWHEGPLFLVHTAYSYTLLLAGVVLLVKAWRTAVGPFRGQMSTIILAAGIPAVASVINVTNLQFRPGAFDPTPIAFTVTGIAVIWAQFRHKLLDLAPVARDVLVDTMNDALVVVDTKGRIVDLNPAAGALLKAVEPGLPPQLVGEPAKRAFAAWPERVLAANRGAFEVSVPMNGHVGHFDVRAAPLRDSKGGARGRLLLLRDETALVEAHREVETANEALRDQLATIEQLHIELEGLAVRDPLTGLFNRRYMDETLQREIARGCREGYRVSVALLDVDSFKRINDTLGHAAGDDVLASIGEILLAQTRAGDACFRYGGDEFLVLMPNIRAEAAAARADEWRKACGLLRPSGGERGRAVTLSIGIATSPQDGRDAAALGAAVDAALYLAKRSGRDRCVIHDAKALNPAEGLKVPLDPATRDR